VCGPHERQLLEGQRDPHIVGVGLEVLPCQGFSVLVSWGVRAARITSITTSEFIGG
jgi:hypothetical protein